MNTKLTLTIKQSIIDKAKSYSKSQGRSLSNIVENYLKAITTEYSDTEIEITPITKALKGSFKAPSGFDYKKELSKSLSKKHLK
ncbi:MAG: hypothetical protein IIB45_07585 [Candidatus Marinimicrobia bacterium]|nr:hypothetical protein [Candidatus Neomarinimicrobiota bacterium]